MDDYFLHRVARERIGEWIDEADRAALARPAVKRTRRKLLFSAFRFRPMWSRRAPPAHVQRQVPALDEAGGR